MSAPRRSRRLTLGPIVGHTDDSSARVWIQAPDDPRQYALRVEDVGLFPFVSTEGAAIEFRTAVAVASGLHPDLRYRYRVVRRGRFVVGADGSFRTLPPPSSMTPLLFCAISCNEAAEEGAWQRFAEYVERAQPSFVLMMGDQVYLDEDKPDTFRTHLDSDPTTRRRAMAEQYRANWSRGVLRRVMAHVPIYMMWDDHDIRDGWGSGAGDSPTMAARHPRGAAIFAKANAYFEDARDVYWHFQGCRNPQPGDIRDPLVPSLPHPSFPNYAAGPAPKGQRSAMPYVFRCGRLVVLVLDSRGERDVFRVQHPILGTRQWTFIDEVFARLPADVDALAVVTPTPIASQDPDGQVQRLYGPRTDDIEAFRSGDERGVFHPKSTQDPLEALKVIGGHWLSGATGRQFNLGNFKVSNIDEARDQWSHRFARAEQIDLLRKVGAARLSNRSAGSGRSVIFLSGDIHVGCRFDISVSKPAYRACSLTSSGISALEDTKAVVGIFVDEDFDVTKGIHSTLRDIVPDYNFGVVEVLPTGRGAEITGTVAHAGNAFAFGIDVKDLV